MDRDSRDLHSGDDIADIDAPDLMVVGDDEDDPAIARYIPEDIVLKPDSTPTLAVHQEPESVIPDPVREPVLESQPDPVDHQDHEQDLFYPPEAVGPGRAIDGDTAQPNEDEIQPEPIIIPEEPDYQPVEHEPEPVPELVPEPVIASPIVETAREAGPEVGNSERSLIDATTPVVTVRASSHDPVDLFSPYDDPPAQDLAALSGPFADMDVHNPAPAQRDWKKSTINTILSIGAAMVIALFVQTFVFQLYRIPTTSMQPGLQVGDTVFATKYTYGINSFSFPLNLPLGDGHFMARLPERGDIAVFVPSHSMGERYVKRVIGLPGDRIRLDGGILLLNNDVIPRGLIGQHEALGATGDMTTYYTYKEILPDSTAYQVQDLGMTALDDTAEIIVPEGFVFVLGDNRDESRDSRVAYPEGPGLVPVSQIVGKAQFIIFSADEGFSLFLPWTWHRIRPSRFFDGLDGGV